MSPEAPPAFRPLVTNGAIWIVNGRIALTDIAVAGHSGEAALWGRNLTDDKHMAFPSSLVVVYPASLERARTFGVDVKFDW